MDLNLKALIGVTYLIPIAITLRKIYAPSFDIPESISMAVAKLDTKNTQSRNDARYDESYSVDLQA